MTPNDIRFFSDRERIYALYHTGKISEAECQKRLNALDDPPPQYAWTAISLVAFFLFGAVVAAVSQ